MQELLRRPESLPSFIKIQNASLVLFQLVYAHLFEVFHHLLVFFLAAATCPS